MHRNVLVPVIRKECVAVNEESLVSVDLDMHELNHRVLKPCGLSS